MPMRTALVFLLLLPAGLLRGQQPEASSASGDEELLQELEDGLLEGLDDLLPPVTPPSREKPAEEDPAPAPSDNPLIDIAQRMRAVERNIARQNTSGQTQQMQRKIVADIEALMEELKKQCSGGGQQPGSRQASSGANSGDGGAEPTQEASRPNESTERVGTSEEEQAEGVRLQNLVKAVWGHLPDRLRQEVQNASGDEFLPQYENLIEEYFRTLAEKPLSSP